MNALLRQRNSSGCRNTTPKELTDSSCAEDHTERAESPNLMQPLRSNGSYGQDKDEYIIPTSQDATSPLPSFAGFSIESPVSSNATLPGGSPITLSIKEETADEDTQHIQAPDDIQTAATPNLTEDAVDSNSVLELQDSADVGQDSARDSSNAPTPVETILTEADVPPLQTRSQLGQIAQDCLCDDPGPFYRSRKRVVRSWAVPSAAERKARLELDILVVTKRKLEAETLKAEAEERRATAETVLLAETLKKCSEEKNKAMAETMFFVQERKRSEEETRKAAAIADFHVEERRKAAAKVDLLLEHRNYYAEQRKTEALKRRVLLLEVQKIRRELKLI